MLNALVRFSIRYRGIVVALGCAFLAYGIFSVYRVPYSDFPDFAPVVVTSPNLPTPAELRRPLVRGIRTLSIRGARWSRNW